MRILIIDEEFPFPLNTGKRIRTFYLTRFLAGCHEVSYLAYDSPGRGAFESALENRIKLYAVEPPFRGKSGIGFYLRLMANLASPLPYIVTSHHSMEFKDKLREIVEGQGFDIIICEWTPYSIFLRDLDSVKKIIVAHNIESDIWNRYRAEERNPFKRWYISVQGKKVERFERECFHWVDGATAVSSADADRIRKFGVGYPVEVVENGVDVEYFDPGSNETEPNTLLFTGSMDWRPNQDAAVYFVDRILPLIRKGVPSIRVYLVGRNPPVRIRKLEKIRGVIVTGTVDDVRPYLRKAAVYIVPLRIGGGSRIKILEALSMKKAVVSTPVGAEGLGVTDGTDILIGRDDSEFAESVLNCLGNNELCGRLGENGRMLVEESYRWAELGGKYARYLESVAGVV
jgi:sugar transferase (PEP-CTERM/EpsH1 system associated)